MTRWSEVGGCIPLTPRRRRRMPGIQSTTPQPPTQASPCRPHHNHRTTRLNAISPYRLHVATIRCGFGPLHDAVPESQWSSQPRRAMGITPQPSSPSGRGRTAAPQLAARLSRGSSPTMLHPCVQTLQQFQLGSPMSAPPPKVGDIWGASGGRHWECDAASCRHIVIGAPHICQICRADLFHLGHLVHGPRAPLQISICFVLFRSVFVVASG